MCYLRKIKGNKGKIQSHKRNISSHHQRLQSHWGSPLDDDDHQTFNFTATMYFHSLLWRRSRCLTGEAGHECRTDLSSATCYCCVRMQTSDPSKCFSEQAGALQPQSEHAFMFSDSCYFHFLFDLWWYSWRKWAISVTTVRKKKVECNHLFIRLMCKRKHKAQWRTLSCHVTLVLLLGLQLSHLSMWLMHVPK